MQVNAGVGEVAKVFLNPSRLAAAAVGGSSSMMSVGTGMGYGGFSSAASVPTSPINSADGSSSGNNFNNSNSGASSISDSIPRRSPFTETAALPVPITVPVPVVAGAALTATRERSSSSNADQLLLGGAAGYSSSAVDIKRSQELVLKLKVS